MNGLLPIEPSGFAAARGYSHGMLAPAGGRLLFVAGQIAWDGEQRLVTADFPGQLEKALENVIAVVRAAGGEAEHIGRLTIFITDRRQYLADLKAVGEAYRRAMGRHYPAMALVEVQALLEPGALVEIEATAVLPAAE